MCDQYQFESFNNVVNKDITIIKEINSGFYNITHSRNIIHNIRQKENKITKEVKKWFRLKDSDEIINKFKTILNIDTISFILNEGVEKKYEGTYVHKDLYQWILQWLDFDYAITIINIINKLQEEYITKIKIQMEEKDSKIDQLIDKVNSIIDINEEQSNMLNNQNVLLNDQTIKINDQTIKINDQTSLIKDQITFIKNQESKIDELQNSVDQTNNTLDILDYKVEEIRDVVHERNNNVNIVPNDDEYNHYITLVLDDDNCARILTGQRVYVERQLRTTYSNKVRIFDDLVYCPNPTTLKTRLKTKIINIISDMKNDIIEQFKSKEINYATRTDMLNELRRNPPFKMSYSNISFLDDVDKLIELVIDVNNERNELPVP